MNLIDVIKNGLKKDELAPVKKGLQVKLGQIKKQIYNRETEINTIKTTAEFDMPEKIINAEENLNKVIMDPNSNYDDLLKAFLVNKKVQVEKDTKDPKVIKLENELEALKELLSAYPTEAEIKALKGKK